MLDRRRAARFITLIVAGLAVAGTSAVMPSPPTQRLNLSGTVRLTREQPAMVQPIDLTVEAGMLDTLILAGSLAQLPANGSIAFSIEPLGNGSRPAPQRLLNAATPQPGGGGVFANATFRETCAGSCPGAYALVLTWVDAPRNGTAEIAWSLSAIALFQPTGGSGAPIRIAIAAAPVAGAPDSTGLSSATSGDPVHLTEGDRFRAWTVELRRAAAAVPNGASPIAQVRLDASAELAAGEPFRGENGKDRREQGRRDPPVQIRLVEADSGLVWRWAGEGPLTFDPFTRCPLAGACEALLTIELAWADGRPNAAYDADWRLDLATIAIDGSVEPIEAIVTALPPLDLATARVSGTFDALGQMGRGEARFVASGSDAQPADSPWTAVGLTARGLVTARVVALPGATLASDDRFTLFARGAGTGNATGATQVTTAEVGLDEEVTFAFETAFGCAPGRPTGCVINGTLGSERASSTPNTTIDDAGYRVEWSLELGAPVTDDGTFEIAVESPESPRP